MYSTKRLHKHCAAILIAHQGDPKGVRRLRRIIPLGSTKYKTLHRKIRVFYCLLVSDLFDRGLHLIPAIHHRNLREDAFKNWGRAVV
ncbi:MAG: hypothetical protein ACI90U_002244 [Pseudomonadales bacterium]|jgi:hypothetical protein